MKQRGSVVGLVMLITTINIVVATAFLTKPVEKPVEKSETIYVVKNPMVELHNKMPEIVNFLDKYLGE